MSDSKAERHDRWSITSKMTTEFEEGYKSIFGDKETWFERRDRERKELLELGIGKWKWLGHDNHTNIDDWECPECRQVDKWDSSVEPNKVKFGCLHCGFVPK